jgi:hypothetical protein
MEPTTAAPPSHTPHETPAHTHPPVPATNVVPAVKPAPPIEDTDPAGSETPPKKTHKDLPKAKAKQPAAAKQPNSGVGMAIAATVIIVLGLAGLATYAFLKTQK